MPWERGNQRFRVHASDRMGIFLSGQCKSDARHLNAFDILPRTLRNFLLQCGLHEPHTQKNEPHPTHTHTHLWLHPPEPCAGFEAAHASYIYIFTVAPRLRPLPQILPTPNIMSSYGKNWVNKQRNQDELITPSHPPNLLSVMFKVKGCEHKGATLACTHSAQRGGLRLLNMSLMIGVRRRMCSVALHSLVIYPRASPVPFYNKTPFLRQADSFVYTGALKCL